MVQGILSRNAIKRIFLQHTGQQIEGMPLDLAVHLFLEVEVTESVLVEDLVVLLALENRAAKQQVVQDDPHREDVADGGTLGRHVLDVDDFRSHKPRSATSHEQVLLLISMGGQSEVTNGHITGILLLEDDVLWFQVAVDDPVFCQMAESSKDVLNDLSDVVS